MKTLLIIITLCLSIFMIALHAIDFKDVPCLPDGDGFSAKETSLIMGHTLRFEANWFKGNECEGDPVARTDYRYRILGNDETHMEVELTSLWMTLLSEEHVQKMNKRKLCDRSDWKLNVTYEIRHPDCLSGRKIGDIFYINKKSVR